MAAGGLSAGTNWNKMHPCSQGKRIKTDERKQRRKEREGDEGIARRGAREDGEKEKPM